MGNETSIDEHARASASFNTTGTHHPATWFPILNIMRHAGGKGYVAEQLAQRNKDGENCLLTHAPHPHVDSLQLLMMAALTAGGHGFLKQLLQQKDNEGHTCLMKADDFNIKIIVGGITECGGSQLLREQLLERNNKGFTPLMLICRECRSPEDVEFLIDTINGLGGRDFLNQQLQIHSNDLSTTPFSAACQNEGCGSSLEKLLVFLATLIYDLGIFPEQYKELWNFEKKKLNQFGIDESWSPYK